MLLDYIVESIELIAQYTAAGKRRFDEEIMVQDAVLRRRETLADAASKLPDGLKERHPDIPWREVQSFRNVAAHDYTGIDLDIVWRIVVDDLPLLGDAARHEPRTVAHSHGSD